MPTEPRINFCRSCKKEWWGGHMCQKEHAKHPEAIAIEHAEYMAKSAERLLEALYNFDLATIEFDNLDAVDVAIESLVEARRNLKSMIYEFRKRAKMNTRSGLSRLARM